jgi:nucleoside-triphosphatase THEP1
LAAGSQETGVSRTRIGLITGPVGVGKTTVAERVVSLVRRQGLACGGLLAPAIRDSYGEKTGIWGVDVRTGERRMLAVAHADRDLGGPTVGPYAFDAKALAWAVVVIESALHPTTRPLHPCALVVVDEIGKLELWQGVGLAPLLPQLAAGEAARSLVVVRDSLLAELQARLGSIEQVVFEVNKENREEMPARILECLL